MDNTSLLVALVIEGSTLLALGGVAYGRLSAKLNSVCKDVDTIKNALIEKAIEGGADGKES